jgi:hypothetical protein
MWLMMRQAGQDLFLSIGADDVEQAKLYNRGLLLMNPPMKAQKECISPYEPLTCTERSVVDQEALDEELSHTNQ